MSKSKQKEIAEYLKCVESATIDEIYKNVSFSYYYNANKYVGEILSRMIKSGHVERVKKGVFKLVKERGVIITTNIDNQKTLF